MNDDLTMDEGFESAETLISRGRESARFMDAWGAEIKSLKAYLGGEGIPQSKLLAASYLFEALYHYEKIGEEQKTGRVFFRLAEIRFSEGEEKQKVQFFEMALVYLYEATRWIDAATAPLEWANASLLRGSAQYVIGLNRRQSSVLAQSRAALEEALGIFITLGARDKENTARDVLSMVATEEENMKYGR